MAGAVILGTGKIHPERGGARKIPPMETMPLRSAKQALEAVLALLVRERELVDDIEAQVAEPTAREALDSVHSQVAELLKAAD